MAPTFGWSAYARRHSRLVLSTLAATLIAAMPATGSKVARTAKPTQGIAPTRSTRRPTHAQMPCWCSNATPTATLGQPVRVQTGGRGIDVRRQSTFRLWMAQARDLHRSRRAERIESFCRAPVKGED